MPGNILNVNDQSQGNLSNDSEMYNSLEAPVVLGVAVVGLLVGCALYHMCYRKFCMRHRNGWFSTRRNRGPRSIAETTNVVSRLFNEAGTTSNPARNSLSNDSLPDYYDLPPSYKDFAKGIPKRKEVASQTSTSSETGTVSDEPPPYEDVRVESSSTEETESVFAQVPEEVRVLTQVVETAV